ncbi:uncharacterized protein LOC141813873 [Curcuma longa]|uniref:uncharacterized protein LOC141813873 n=1 Tax=Curcuma longa TaxID=136217 RepID=UPI003D9E5012
MRGVALRILRSHGLRRGFPRPPSTVAASRSSGSLLPGVTTSSAAPQPQAGDSTVEIFPEFGTQLFGASLLGSRRTLILSGRNNERTSFFRQFSSINESEDLALEEEAERKFGWVLKAIFVGTAGLVVFQFFPYMGDNLLQQSISLLRVKDPLFKRMGASRLRRFAVDDGRRMRVVELGGARELLNMLKTAKDDKTRKEALKALVALSHSDEAAGALHQEGAAAIISSTPNSLEFAEVEAHKSSILKRFQELKYEMPTEVEVVL